ncbi:phosphohistidine phosphatase SixA [Aeromonas sp. R9-1]|uniref:phosphohistidine phosphatase SixA n=1 Tax=Aeromonas sp. R9-1 TaxID=3138478 RepID=UPI0034A47F69
MKIYIMRHGQAGMNAKSDESRPLTEQGLHESVQMARWLAPQMTGLDRVIHSPYLRARETWLAICSELPEARVVEESDEITPYGDAARVASYLEALAGNAESLLVVSHLPLVGYLVHALCPGHEAPLFATSGMACIDFENGRGELRWLEGPHTIR